MKLVVGLGNPGSKYRGTRHNVGYDVLAELARRYGAGKPRNRFAGETVDVLLDGVRVLLLSPTTYMNRSGRSVAEAAGFFKLGPEDLMVVCDDLSLPLGKLRVRAKGSSGGHKGLEDIIRSLGTEHFPRLRVGIGSPPPGLDAADYVLMRFSAEEQVAIREAVTKACDAVAVWVAQGIDACMNRYN
ncbi:MAG: aminoacyl-tRNA hydrolase [Thermogutta sp.]|nr:aminoacyl-tRNA hydrolase [Thermogutta sp.]